MINMAFMPLYMWEMWDVTPVTHTRTHTRTVESRAVFCLSRIRNRFVITLGTKRLKLSPLKNWIFQIVPICIYMTGIKKKEWSSDLLKLLWTRATLSNLCIYKVNPYRGDGFNSIVWQNGQIKSISVKTPKSFKRRGSQATEWHPRRKQLSLAITQQVRKLLTTLCKVTQL